MRARVEAKERRPPLFWPLLQDRGLPDLVAVLGGPGAVDGVVIRRRRVVRGVGVGPEPGGAAPRGAGGAGRRGGVGLALRGAGALRFAGRFFGGPGWVGPGLCCVWEMHCVRECVYAVCRRS